MLTMAAIPLPIRKALFLMAITPMAIWFVGCLLLSRLIDKATA